MKVLNIYICEDNDVHREQIKKMVETYVMIENLDMKVVLVTHSPYYILKYLELNEKEAGIYFLDVKLEGDLDGIALANKIREYDPRGFIVFISAYSNALPFTFKYKVEAMDFIVKDEFFDIRLKIEECIQNAHKKYTAKTTKLQRVLSIKLFDQLITVPLHKILYFETSQNAKHKVIIYLENGFYEFYGSLKDLEKLLDDRFFRCHNSYIVNLDQIKLVDFTNNLIMLKDDKQSCPIAARNLKKLQKLLKC